MDGEVEDETAYIRGQLDFHIVTGRYSSLLVKELARCVEERRANISPIFHEIGFLEGATHAPATRRKPAAPFRGSLRGLWHKHYFQPAFIAKNVLNHWTSKGDFEARVEEIARDQAIPDEKKIGAAVQAYVMVGYQERSNAAEMTGEWIVYARHDEVNYYLTLGTHTESDAVILSRVRACCHEFPHLDIYK